MNVRVFRVNPTGYPVQNLQHNGVTHFLLSHSFLDWRYGRRDLRRFLLGHL